MPHLNLKIAGAAIALQMALGIVAADAATLSFEKITSNTSLDASSQIVVEVTDGPHLGTDGAFFRFSAVAGTLTSFKLAEIYWDDSALGIFNPPPIEVDSSDGIGGSEVSYTEGSGSPGSLSSGGSATPAFVSTTGLIADADSPAPKKAVDIGEFYKVFLAYKTGFDFGDVVGALDSGDLRLGIHVTSHNGGGSESYVGGGCIGSDCPSVVPLPAGLPLLATALGIGFLFRRSRKSA